MPTYSPMPGSYDPANDAQRLLVSNCEHFTTWILCEMSADMFIDRLRTVDMMPYAEFLRLSRVFIEAENEMIAHHVMYPNDY